jgi:FHA domain
MDIVRKLRRLESRLARTVDEASQKMTPAGKREPLEILYAIVDAAEKRIEPAGRGKFVFPFNRITIRMAVDCRETRARFEAVLGSEPPLYDRIIERLQAAGCELTGLNVETTYVDRAESHWTNSEFHVEFDRLDGPPQPAWQSTVAHPSLKLTILRGTTETPTYVFTMSRINIGRCADVRDNRNRLIRTNHVAFAEHAGEPNLSVSRHHAHIDGIASPGEYRLCDDRSAHGTNVLRNGKTIAVPSGPRGVRLQSGDEITLGEARLHVEIKTHIGHPGGVPGR